MRAARARMQALIALGAVSGQALIHPAARHAVRGRDLTDAQAFQHDSLDHIADQVHRTPPRRCPRCLATSVRYLMKRSTFARSNPKPQVIGPQPEPLIIIGAGARRAETRHQLIETGAGCSGHRPANVPKIMEVEAVYASLIACRAPDWTEVRAPQGRGFGTHEHKAPTTS